MQPQFDFQGNQFTGDIQQKIFRLMSPEQVQAPSPRHMKSKKKKPSSKKKAIRRR